jgi:hypothetical protein
MTPDTGWSGGHYWRKEDELLVTVQGLMHCGDEALADLDLLAIVLRFFADRERSFEPSTSHAAEDIVITSDDLRRDLKLIDGEVAKAFVLLQQFEANLRFSSGGTETVWQWMLDGELIRKYRAIEDGRTYLQARGDLPPRPPKSFVGKIGWRSEKSWLALRGAAIRN